MCPAGSELKLASVDTMQFKGYGIEQKGFIPVESDVEKKIKDDPSFIVSKIAGTQLVVINV